MDDGTHPFSRAVVGAEPRPILYAEDDPDDAYFMLTLQPGKSPASSSTLRFQVSLNT